MLHRWACKLPGPCESRMQCGVTVTARVCPETKWHTWPPTVPSCPWWSWLQGHSALDAADEPKHVSKIDSCQHARNIRLSKPRNPTIPLMETLISNVTRPVCPAWVIHYTGTTAATDIKQTLAIKTRPIMTFGFVCSRVGREAHPNNEIYRTEIWQQTIGWFWLLAFSCSVQHKNRHGGEWRGW